MPITIEEAQKGVRVKIPTQKTSASNYKGFKEELDESEYSLPYLLIDDSSDPTNVGLNYDSSSKWLSTNSFQLQDLDLYTEEQDNPTTCPLPEESFQGNTEDPVNPTHYKGKEVFNQMIQAFGVEKVKAFCELNVYKYLTRAGKKEGNSVAQEYGKASWYLNELKALNNIPNRE